MMRRLYDWILELAGRPNALPVLTALSFAESVIFPVPPDTMLMPMVLAKPERAYRYALWCSIGSLLGGIAGYALGMLAWGAIQGFFYDYVPGFTLEKFATFKGLYEDWDIWIVFTAGFTPIPYKVITISAGVAAIAFPPFVLASAVSRSARFFLVAWILKRWGPPAQTFVERNFGLVSLAFVALLVGGFVLISQI
jgi:membrane protein YqaA with SNARE-associated domain